MKNEIKLCCENFYQSEVVKFLLGDSFHPGSLKLTRILGERPDLSKDDYVLDVACGVGSSAIFLAKNFGCKVMGMDLGEKNIETMDK
ncbi:MAG: SAM-dependent methyltransferase [bacterium]